MSKIAILNAGGQYCHLIAIRIRELGVYSEIYKFDTDPYDLKYTDGIILSGGPDSVYMPNSPKVSSGLFDIGIPILGICYGFQLMVQMQGGVVNLGKIKEFGIANIKINKKDYIFDGLNKNQTVWMSHGDTVEKLPEDFELLSLSDNNVIAAAGDLKKKIYGFQFHPEVSHTVYGKDILSNFVFKVCKIKQKDWNPKNRIKPIIETIKDKAQGKKIFFFISGGIDSTVAFTLCVKALGKENVKGIYVDTGLMRKNETESLMDDFNQLELDNIEIVEARDKFLSALKYKHDPEEKREIIGKLFVEIQEDEFMKFDLGKGNWLLGQGTIYPDTIESGCADKNVSKIKTHHNRVNEILKLINENRVIEPLTDFYKDGVRELARSLNLPDHIVMREPFPGPGLAIRCICSDQEKYIIKDDRLKLFLSNFNLNGFSVPVKTVGVQGDFRSYKNIAVIYGNAPFFKLKEISTKIVNSFDEINRVAYIVKTESPVDKMRIYKSYISTDRLKKLKEADYIVREFIDKHKERLPEIWQFPIIIFPLGYNNDETIVLRPILSSDGMTAKVAEIDNKLLNRLVENIISIKGVSTVLYDLTNKPPGTIEWE